MPTVSANLYVIVFVGRVRPVIFSVGAIRRAVSYSCLLLSALCYDIVTSRKVPFVLDLAGLPVMLVVMSS